MTVTNLPRGAILKNILPTATDVKTEGEEHNFTLSKIAGNVISIRDVMPVSPGQKIAQDKNGIWVTTGLK